jgi:hypothetical protein
MLWKVILYFIDSILMFLSDGLCHSFIVGLSPNTTVEDNISLLMNEFDLTITQASAWLEQEPNMFTSDEKIWFLNAK